MKLRTVSWVMLTVLGSFVLLVSFVSTYRAYRGNYAIGGTAVGAVASGRQEVLLALRGIRGTSAAYAAAYAVLFLSVVLGPYKRGETWPGGRCWAPWSCHASWSCSGCRSWGRTWESRRPCSNAASG